jgi:hypothetical protein
MKNVKVKMAEHLEFLKVRNVIARHVKLEGTKPVVVVFDSWWFKESKVVDNSGIFGGIYFIGEFILSMISCKFKHS